MNWKKMLSSMPPKEARLLAVAAAIRAGIVPRRPGIASALVTDETDDRAEFVLVGARGVTHVGELLHWANEVDSMTKDEQLCRHCGCSHAHPCPEGCAWLTEDCCTDPRCVAKLPKSRQPKRARKP